MSKILPILIVLIAVGGAGFGAMTLRGGAPSQDLGEEYGGDAGAQASLHKVKGKKKEDDTAVAYFKFQRSFIVPVMRSDHVDAIVMISLNIEMDEDVIETIRPKEPKYRDAFMRTFMQLSHEGIFNKDITDPNVFEVMQERLEETAALNIGSEARQVLIVDFARQDR